MKKGDIIERLTTHGIKPSLQRMAIMEYLMTHRTHPTVEDVYNGLCRSIPTLSKTTVYNTLRMFAEQGAATMITIDDHRVCYDGEMAPHAHFFCRQCGKVYDLYSEKAPVVVESFEAEGHQVLEAQLYYKGVCAKCRNKREIN